MFAVPGWAVSASSLVQQKPRSKDQSSRPDANTPMKKPEKRKRIAENDDNGNGITAGKGATAHATTGKPSKQPRIENMQTKVANQDPKIVRSPGLVPERSIPKTVPKNGYNVADGKAGAQTHGDSKTLHTKDRQYASKEQSHAQVQKAAIPPPPPASATTKLTPLQAKMRSKLTSARFRHLNETLYTTSSSDAFKLFSSSPELFADYHAGFAQQVKESWPQNPVEDYIKAIKTRGTPSDSRAGVPPLPRRKTGSCTIADLGCGDAPLARGCQSTIRSLKLKFHNYDLHAASSLIVKADIANLPLRDGEADIAVFCLSLMGTNWISFVEEAWRILRGDGKGEVWVAEVKSRFGRVTRGRVVENSVGKRRKSQKPMRNGDDGNHGPEQFAEDNRMADEPEDETDITAFIKVFTRRGFQLREGSVNKRNKMFVSMTFVKTGIATAGKYKGMKWTGKEYQKLPDGKSRFAGGQKHDDEITPEEEAKVLKPCVYKVR